MNILVRFARHGAFPEEPLVESLGRLRGLGIPTIIHLTYENTIRHEPVTSLHRLPHLPCLDLLLVVHLVNAELCLSRILANEIGNEVNHEMVHDPAPIP